MTTTTLVTGLTDCAAGLRSLEAGASLVIGHSTFLLRDEFAGPL